MKRMLAILTPLALTATLAPAEAGRYPRAVDVVDEPINSYLDRVTDSTNKTVCYVALLSSAHAGAGLSCLKVDQLPPSRGVANEVRVESVNSFFDRLTDSAFHVVCYVALLNSDGAGAAVQCAKAP